MKQVVLTLLASALALIEENIGEIRERCSDPLHAKFVGLHASIGDAIREGALDTPVDPAPVAVNAAPLFTPEQLAEVVEHLGDRMALEVRAALDEAKA